MGRYVFILSRKFAGLVSFIYKHTYIDCIAIITNTGRHARPKQYMMVNEVSSRKHPTKFTQIGTEILLARLTTDDIQVFVTGGCKSAGPLRLLASRHVKHTVGQKFRSALMRKMAVFYVVNAFTVRFERRLNFVRCSGPLLNPAGSVFTFDL